MFRRAGRSACVLNEGLHLDRASIDTFCAHVFESMPDVMQVDFHAIAPLTAIPLESTLPRQARPCLSWPCTEDIVLYLPDSADTYLGRLGKATRKSMKKTLSRARRELTNFSHQIVSGAALDDKLPNAAAWVPVSEVPFRNGSVGYFPHLIDRYKPGVIAVNGKGRRFVNESNSYHDVGCAVIAGGEPDAVCWLVCDHATIRKYGLGFAKPFPVPLGLYLSVGYVQRGKTLKDLARIMGIDADALEKTVRDFNNDALRGEDKQFLRGSTAYNRFLGDPAHAPNPCVGPIRKPPYYAVKTYMGDLGTFAGIKTDARARALDKNGNVKIGRAHV